MSGPEARLQRMATNRELHAEWDRLRAALANLRRSRKPERHLIGQDLAAETLAAIRALAERAEQAGPRPRNREHVARLVAQAEALRAGRPDTTTGGPTSPVNLDRRTR